MAGVSAVAFKVATKCLSTWRAYPHVRSGGDFFCLQKLHLLGFSVQDVQVCRKEPERTLFDGASVLNVLKVFARLCQKHTAEHGAVDFQRCPNPSTDGHMAMSSG